jgi:hypothetical protein
MDLGALAWVERSNKIIIEGMELADVAVVPERLDS